MGDFPIKHGGSFHSFLYVYQRVNPIKSHQTTIKPPFSMGKSTMNGHVQWQTVSLPEGIHWMVSFKLRGSAKLRQAQ